MQKESQESRIIFFEWDAPARYFEKKQSYYFKAIIALGVLFSLLFYFLNEYILLFVVWVLVFVAYVRALVPPPTVHYKLTKFGIQFYTITIAYKHLSSFTIIKRPLADVVRFFISPSFADFYILLPQDRQQKEQILDFLEAHIPYVEHVQETEIERIASFLKRVSGFD